MANSFTFKCGVCDDGVFHKVIKTSSNELIPLSSAEVVESFCVTCPKCYSIFSVIIRPELTLQMNSNLVRGKVVR